MKTYLITGTNRGIGLEFCKQLTAGGKKVIAVCRKPSEELKSLNVHIEEGIDVSNEKDVLTLPERLKNTSIDVLIHNAGIMRNESIQDMRFDQIREQFEVNTLAPIQLSLTLLPYLKQGSKIIFITSRMGSLGDNTSGSRYGYRMSKAAVNMAAISLSHDLRERGIAIGILHPGMVSTDMTGHQGISPTESVQQLLIRIQELNLENSGQFKHANGETLPW